MKKFFGKKRVAALTVVAVLVVAAAAIAYWTTTGSGNATGTVGTASNVSLSGSFASNSLYPGVSGVTVNISATQQTTSYKLGAVTGVVSTSDAGCLASWFSFHPPTDASQTVAGGTGTQALSSGTIDMADSASNQDACKNATVTIALSAAKLTDGS
jgi:hypothetical protein